MPDEKTPEEIAAEEAAAAAEREAEEAAAAAREAEEAAEEEGDDGELPDSVKAILAKERKARREADRKRKDAERIAAEHADAARRLKEYEDAQLSESQRTAQALEDQRAETQRQRDRADKLAIDSALRQAASEAGIPAKKIRRALRLVDRDDIVISGDEVTGAEDAIEALLDEIPEFKEAPESAPEDEPSGEPAGGAPDRRRKPSPLTTEQVKKMIKDDPEKFNELFEAGKIPASALR